MAIKLYTAIKLVVDNSPFVYCLMSCTQDYIYILEINGDISKYFLI